MSWRTRVVNSREAYVHILFLHICLGKRYIHQQKVGDDHMSKKDPAQYRTVQRGKFYAGYFKDWVLQVGIHDPHVT